MSKLISDDLISTIPNLYTTEDEEDPICHIKLFTPDANWTWYIIEFSTKDNDTCFGYVVGLESELGYFSLREVEAIRGRLGLLAERDFRFISIKLSEVKKKSTTFIVERKDNVSLRINKFEDRDISNLILKM